MKLWCILSCKQILDTQQFQCIELIISEKIPAKRGGKRMIQRKLFITIAAAAMTVGIFTGCGSNQKQTANNETTAVQTTEAATEEVTATVEHKENGTISDQDLDTKFLPVVDLTEHYISKENAEIVSNRLADGVHFNEGDAFNAKEYFEFTGEESNFCANFTAVLLDYHGDYDNYLHAIGHFRSGVTLRVAYNKYIRANVLYALFD